MTTKKAKLGDFRPQQRNANKHTERGLGMLEKSIGKNGWIGAMTAANDGEIFDGSARLEKVADVLPADPIVVESDGTRPIVIKRTDIKSAKSHKAVRLALEANRIAQVDLDWDVDILAEIEQSKKELLEGLFSDKELKALGLDFGESIDAAPQVDRAAELLEKWQVKTGDLWQIGEHRLICGDCTDAATVARVMQGEKAQFCFTDPPYGVKYTGGTKKWSMLENDDEVNMYAASLPLIYEHTDEKANEFHPTQKPPDLYMRAMRNSAPEDCVVFEPFSGSGTSLVACQNLSRKCRAIEISPAYVAVALQRMSDAFPDLEIKRLK